MDKNDKIFIAGHRGLAGSAITRNLQAKGFTNLIQRDRRQLDLSNEPAVTAFFEEEKPDMVVLAAARVGGIKANADFPVEFLLDNLRIQNNVISAAHASDVRKLLFLGSSCIYPKHAPQPIHEDSLLTGPLEPTNEAYAIAKISGLKLCQFYRQQYGAFFHSAMPTNLYGPGDNYHPQNSHVLPALIRRFHEAKERKLSDVTAWGTGSPRREFLHVDDLADACAFLMRAENPPDWINVGTGSDVTIRELTELVASVVGFSGRILWDASKPDGTPRKLLDVSKLAGLGWRAKIGLREGITATYADFLQTKAAGTLRS